MACATVLKRIILKDHFLYYHQKMLRDYTCETVLVGTFFVVGDSGDGDYRSLTDEECEAYMERFAEPEEISQEEIDENTGFTVMPFDTYNPFDPI